MEKITEKSLRGIVSVVIVTVLCFMLFVPAIQSGNIKDLASTAVDNAYANGDEAADGIFLTADGSAQDPGNGSAGSGVGPDGYLPGAQAELPDYAVLANGRPNPAFIGADGKLFEVSPEEYADIVAEWEDPAIDTEGMPTVLELLGHIPADPGTEADRSAAGGPEDGKGPAPAKSAPVDGALPDQGRNPADGIETGEAGAAGARAGNAADDDRPTLADSGAGDSGTGKPDGGADPEYEAGTDETQTDEAGAGDVQPEGTAPVVNKAKANGGISALGGEIVALSVDYPYFFHLAGQTDPYGSGHSYRQYYVPAGSDIPMLSFCLEMGKNAPPDSVKVAYTPMAAPGWSTALATYGPAVLRSYGIDTETDNEYRQWAMQDAVWALSGSGIGAAASAPVIQSLISAALGSVSESNPSFSGISDGGVLQAHIYDDDYVRYGPFSISGMSGTAVMTITSSDGKNFPAAWLGDASGGRINMSAVPGGRQLYVYVPRSLDKQDRINIKISAPYVLPSTMQAFQAPNPSYQNQLVTSSWSPNSGTLSISAKLGGFGEGEVLKLDSGWNPGCLEIDYNGDGKGDVYRLEGAVFKIQEWRSSGFVDSNIDVVYEPDTRVYRIGFMTETAANNGRFRLVETKTPYGYRYPAALELDFKAKYDPVPREQLSDIYDGLEGGPDDIGGGMDGGSGMWYAMNDLLNVRIELQKRDNTDSNTGFSNPAYPQGDASLAGAYYGLFYKENVTDPSGIERKAGEVVCIGITDENGRVVFQSDGAEQGPSYGRLLWSADGNTNFGTMDVSLFLPAFDRQDRRIYPALYYIKELVPSPGYIIDLDPAACTLDVNGVPLAYTGPVREYIVDARDNGTAGNPIGIQIELPVTEQVKMRGFLLQKGRSDGSETEMLPLNGAGFSVYLINDLVEIIQKAALADPGVNVPEYGPAGWDKQDFIDFFYDPEYIHPPEIHSGKDWYDPGAEVFKGRYNFDIFPELKRARIGFVESPVFYSSAPLIPGLRYGKYGYLIGPQDGEVIFPEFPYGEYIVFETYVPYGVQRVKPIVVSIREDAGDIYDFDWMTNPDRPELYWRVALDSDMFSIRLWKKDAETGNVVMGKDAAFRLKYLGADGVEGGNDDKWVEMVVPGPSGIVRWGTAENPFRVGENGILILPKMLQAGNYKLYEVEAPSGYVLSYHEAVDEGGYDYSIAPDAQPDVGIVFDSGEAHRVAEFDIDEDGYDDFVLELIQFNEQQKGRINIHKERETVDSRPDAAEGAVPFEGVRFELLAAEDIRSLDGRESLLYRKDELVAYAYTDENGNAYFKDLRLGKYLLVEADIDDKYKVTVDGERVPIYTFPAPIEVDLCVPEGANLDPASPYYQGNPVICLSYDLLNQIEMAVTVEVDKDTIRRTSAAFVSLPGQAGYNNVGKPEERYRYDIDFRSTAGIWADEFVVDDPLENVINGKVFVEELWTPVVWGDYDGLWNLWYATNKTDPNKDYSLVSAMDTNPYNPNNPDGVAAYPNTGYRLLAKGLRTDRRYHFTLEDFGLSGGEYLTHLRFEYGRVEVGFTSMNYAKESLNGEHRVISGADLKLPSKAEDELMLLDPAGYRNPAVRADGYITGIEGDIVDWTPVPGTLFYAEGAANPGYKLKPASYLVSAAKPMSGVDIVSSVSARIARDVTMRAYDQDAVVTREIGTFKYAGSMPDGGAPPKTGDDFSLLIWLLALLSASVGLLLVGRITAVMRSGSKNAQ